MSSTGWSPFLSSSTTDIEESDSALAKEVDMLQRAVQEHGELKRADLGRLVGCRYWGPGRYGRALKVAVKLGRIARPRRGVYGPV